MRRIGFFLTAVLLWVAAVCPASASGETLPNSMLGRKVAVSSAALETMEDTSMKIQVAAKGAVLMEASTGKILMGENENERLYPASVTKIMSMLLVCEALDEGRISLTDMVTADENACSKGGSQIWLEVGEQMSVDDLLKATAVYSANDACTLLGEYVAGSDEAFVAMMNDRAAQLGMTNTHFDNCTGLDDTTQTHLTTAYDIALMARALTDHEIIRNYSCIWMDSLRGGETQLVNTNKLVRTYKGITGLKTGTTDKAGCCLCATAERDGLSLIAVVLGCANSNDRFEGAKAMLDWGFANFECYTPELPDEEMGEVRVLGGEVDAITPECADFAPILVSRGQGVRVTREVELVEDVKAPVEKGQKLGVVRFKSGEETLCEYDLCARDYTARLSFPQFLKKVFTCIG